jgi:hypothetical protein
VTQPPAAARRVEVAVDRLSGWLDRFADRHGPIDASLEGSAVLVRAADDQRALLTPPFAARAEAPPAEAATRPVSWLQTDVRRPRRVAALLIRRGGHAAGVYDGAELIASKVGRSYVQGTTKAGGWSQHRYARRRDNQTKSAVADAIEESARTIAPYLSSLEGAVLGGDRALIRLALADRRLAGLAQLPAEPFLDVGEPRLATLQGLPEQFLVVRIALWP